MKIYRTMIAEGKTLAPRHQYYDGCELYYHKLYEDAISVLGQFPDSPGGWIENKLEDLEKAKEYNEKAGACKPYSKAYLHNKHYFNHLQTSQI